MKRILAIILTGTMTVGMMIVSLPKEKVVAPPKEIIETQTYHTNIDYSLLYSLEEETRKEEEIDLTYPEAQLMMLIGRSEGGSTLLGQLWVMRVLWNRVKSDAPDFKDVNDIGSVIFQSGQFQVVSTEAYKNVKLNVESHLALGLLEAGWNGTDGALWFESKSNSENSWHKKNLVFIAEVDGNLYYK